MTAALTPYRWPIPEMTYARVAFICAVTGEFPRMEENLRRLPPAALVDLRYALDVMHPIVRAMADPPATVNASDRLPVPCPRCGHEERRHQRAPLHATACLDCPDAFCQPRKVGTS